MNRLEIDFYKDMLKIHGKTYKGVLSKWMKKNY